jgi:SAM-dependent methyltransferase
MTDWAARTAVPARVVDPGAGSGRFLLEAARRFPGAQLLGIEIDPLAALIARANLSAAGHADRAHIILGDYRSALLPHLDGKTLFIGNPPYVRHHLIEPRWKEWLTTEARRRGLAASQLAGLHVHFFLATAALALPGDFGAFITSAEWLDVNYGRLVRDVFLGPLGGKSILVLEPTVRAFADAATTSAIATFVIGERPGSLRLRRIASPDGFSALGSGQAVRRDRLASETHWSRLTRRPRAVPDGHVELGELCRVHRGAATGANGVWIAGAHSGELSPSLLLPAVTRARELIAAAPVLVDADHLRRVIDLPVDLDALPPDWRRPVERFLKWARRGGAHQGYLARHRKAWWAVELRPPPPILSTYMARRPPVFVLNFAGARYLNIAHGLYPRDPMPSGVLTRLARHLNAEAVHACGRVYAGGLVKLEPRELERMIVPGPALLAES